MTQSIYSVKHLKLITGEEIICNLLEESPDNLVVNNALSLTEKSLENGSKFYAFKTYMVYQDTPTNVIMIFTDKIVSLALPTKEMLTQYGNAIKEMETFMSNSELEGDYDEDNMSLEDFIEEMESASQSSLNIEEIDSDTNGMIMN
jgi:hypothetical protein